MGRLIIQLIYIGTPKFLLMVLSLLLAGNYSLIMCRTKVGRKQAVLGFGYRFQSLHKARFDAWVDRRIAFHNQLKAKELRTRCLGAVHSLWPRKKSVRFVLLKPKE
jgi:phosphoserine phosphatase